MLLDIGTVFAGIGLAIVGFIVVIVVCAVILALLAAILPSYEGRTTAEKGENLQTEGAEAPDPSPAEDASPVDAEAGGTVTAPAEEDPPPGSDTEGDPAA